MALHPALRQTARVLAIGAGAALGLVVLALLLVLVPGVRTAVLDQALARTNRALPGTLDVQERAWPSAGVIELGGIRWMDGPDTLLTAGRVELHVDLFRLLRRDVHVRRLVLDRLRLDVPALTQRFPADTAEQGARGRSFPRDGSVPGVPSVAVDDLALNVDAIRLQTGEAAASLRLHGAFDLLRGSAPRIEITGIEAFHPASGVHVQPGSLYVDLHRGRMDGEIRGSIGEPWPFILTARTNEDDAYRLEWRVVEPDGTPSAAGLLAEGTFDRDGATVRSLTYVARLEAPDAARLSALPGWRDLASRLPADRRASARASGTVQFLPRFQADVDFTAEPFMTLETLRATAMVHEDGFAVQSFALEASGIDASGTWRQHGEDPEGEVTFHVQDLSALAPFLPGVTLPDSLLLRGTASLGGRGRRVDARANGRLVLAATVVDSLQITAQGELRQGRGVRTDVRLKTSDLWVHVFGDVREEDGIDVRLSPVRLSYAAPASDAQGPTPSRIRMAAGGGDVRATSLHVSGVLGEANIDARWTGDAGQARATLRWPEPPEILVRALALDSLTLARIVPAWSASGMPRAEIEASARSSGTWKATATALLPGPAQFAALLPDSARVSDLGPVTAGVRVEGNADGSRGTLDLADTDWIEEGRAAFASTSTGLTLDTLVLRTHGLHLGSAAGSREGALTGRVNADLTDAGEGWLARLVPDLANGRTFDAAADASLGGRLGAPDLSIELAANASGAGLRVPQLRGGIDIRAGRLARGHVRADSGVVLGDVVLDVVRVDARPMHADSGLFPALVGIEARGRDLELMQVMRVVRRSGWETHTDTLGLRIADATLSSTRPIFAAFDPATAAFAIDGLELAGTMGQVSGHAVSGPDSTDIAVTLSLDHIPRPAWLDVPDRMWPSSVNGRLRATSRDTLSLVLSTAGLGIGPRTGVLAELAVVGKRTGFEVRLRMSDGSRTLVQADGVVPADIRLRPLTVRSSPDPMRLDVRLDGVPVPARLGEPGALEDFMRGEGLQQPPELTGRAVFRGTFEQPAGAIDAQIAFPRWRRMKDHRIALQAKVSPGGAMPRDVDTLVAVAVRPEPGISATFRWERPSASPATGEAFIPLERVTGTLPRIAKTRPMSAHVSADRWSLSELNELLASGVTLEGMVTFHLTLAGDLEEAKLGGRLNANRISISTSDGNQAFGQGDLTFDGTAREPVVNGTLTMRRGRLMVPETPRELHAVEGEALLWSKTPVDTTQRVRVVRRASAVGALDTLVSPTVTIDLDIPGAFVIQGRGLDVELAGKLDIAIRGTEPRLLGELKAVRGDLTFLGSRFTVERGTVSFFGGEGIDPQIDIVLARRKTDVTVRARMTGLASNPQLELSSDPAMADGDIVSYLLFGRAANDLDREQSALLETQATEALQSYAVRELGSSLGRQVGLDVVDVRPADDPSQESSIVVGKYLSPRALLKYEQSPRGTQSSINLEYWLTRHFKVETISSLESQSGIELNWSQDY